jgi:hypothetical protein
MPELRDKQMILNPMRWPLLVLPLKKSDPFQPGNMAVFAPPLNTERIAEDQPIEIRIGTMYDKLWNLPTISYPNVDALLADGWKVD